MNLSEPFIKRPVMTCLVMTAIAFFGVICYRALPVSDLPNVDMPTIEVNTSYPGANPDTMANSVTTPLEQQFMTLQGIQTITSSSNTGSSTIVLSFDLSRNLDSASTDVQAAISRAQPNLPTNLPSLPTYEKVNPAATPILYLAITSENMTLAQLYDYADTFIGNRITMVDGVAQVQAYGTAYAARIQVDPEKLAAKNIGIDEVTRFIQNSNVNLPLGTLYGDRDDFTIDADGQLLKASGYNEIIIKNQNGELVKIKDIGNAKDSIGNDKYFKTYVTKEKKEVPIILAIQRLPGMNTVKIIEGIKKTLDELKPQLPGSLKIYTVYDQSESINESVHEVEFTLLVAFILVVLVIYLSLGKLLNTVIPTISLPLSLLGTCIVMYLLGFSIDILSLLAITLSIGFLVDDAIVVLENNVRHVQLGESPMEASIKGSKEISITVLSMTLCLIAAFIPMAFMSGVIGKLFNEFAVTIIVAILFSGFISLSLVPLLSSRFVKPYSHKEKKPKMEQIADYVNERMLRVYRPALYWAMNHRLIMIAIGIGCIVASLFLFNVLRKDLLPPDDVGFIQGFVVAREGTSPYLMNDYHDEITKIGIGDNNVESILSISSVPNPNQGVLFFRLKPYSDRLAIGQVLSELGNKFKNIPGANVYLSQLPLINLTVGTTATALYQYSLTSLNREILYNYAPKLVDKMRANRNFTAVSSDLFIHQPQLQLNIDRDKASNFNINAADIENYFQYAYSDNRISQINAEINQYNVLIETLPRFYKDPTVLSKLYVRSSKNALVPVSEILKVEETVGPLMVNHTDGISSVGISFNLPEGITLSQAIQSINELTKNEMPSEVYGQVIGTAGIFVSSFESINFLLFLSFFTIYIVLGILYESLIHPITVMSTLPPVLFGGLLSLYLFNQVLSFYSFVGLILLIGIVLKNGIMMVDFAIIASREEKKKPYDSAIEACLIRFRPIMMTTFCALMGAVPIALGMGGAMATNRIPLGIAVVGGLIISQMLTLLLTPVLYYYFETIQEKVRDRFARKKRRKKRA